MTHAWTRTLRLGVLAVAGIVLLAACEAEPKSDEPLSGYLVASRLVGHTARVTDVTGNEYYLSFAYNGVVRIDSEAPHQYERWTTDKKGQLCLHTGDGTENCAPLYQLTVERFRWGATIFVLVR
ncbi:MAG TPA: hypothetical protein VMU85_23090 [Stellaceae bacterium]|nr:hypothetical protein [Stellaceae bacterium]